MSWDFIGLSDGLPVRLLRKSLMKDKPIKGVIVAFRADGNEALFASREGHPLQWVPIGDCISDASGMPTIQDYKNCLKRDDDEHV